MPTGAVAPLVALPAFPRGFGAALPWGMPRIDWANPLARGLVGAFYAGDGGSLVNLVNPDVSLKPASSGGIASTLIGSGVAGTANSQGASAVAPKTLQVTGSMSMFWYGVLTADNSGNSTMIGVTATNNDSSPFLGYELGRWGGAPGTIAFNYNSAGSFGSWQWTSAAIDTAAYGKPVSFLVAAPASGPNACYRNGVSQGAGALSQGAIYAGTQTYTTPVAIFGAYTPVAARYLGGNSITGFIWNRAVNAGEAKALADDPVQFLIWPEDDIWSGMLRGVVTAGGASVTYPQLERFRPRGLTRGLAA